jgi:hypothetical protein
MTHYRTSLAVVPASSLAPGKRGMGIQAVAATETVTPSVIPAQAGIGGLPSGRQTGNPSLWIPAFAGMTKRGRCHDALPHFPCRRSRI